MKNKAVIVVIILLLLGAGAYFILSRGKANLPGGKVSSGESSLKDLIAAGIPQKCTFASSMEGETSEGTTYVSGGKVRGDFTNTASGKTTLSHMITDGKTSYIWTDGEKSGLKMTVTETDATPVPAGSQPQGKVTAGEADLNAKADYKCSSWLPDNSVFIPPSSVIFTDFSQMFNVTPAPAASGAPAGETSSQCAYCDSLTGEDKTSCLSALNCK